MVVAELYDDPDPDDKTPHNIMQGLVFDFAEMAYILIPNIRPLFERAREEKWNWFVSTDEYKKSTQEKWDNDAHEYRFFAVASGKNNKRRRATN